MAEITNEQYQELRAKGYSDAEISQALGGINYAQQQASPSSTSMYGTSGMQTDIIKWQLEMDSIIERVEHLLKRDILTVRGGNQIWMPGNPADAIFNEFGVAEIMRACAMYINRNTILSNYDEDTIKNKCYQFGSSLNDLIYMKYEEMGLDTVEKQKIYPMLVREVTDMVHSTYLRALNGMTTNSLRHMTSFNQVENMNPPMMAGQRQGMLKGAYNFIFGGRK